MSTSHYNINSSQQTREIGTCCYPHYALDSFLAAILRDGDLRVSHLSPQPHLLPFRSPHLGIQLQAQLHPSSRRNKLCVWIEHTRDHLNTLELFVDNFPVHVEHSAFECARKPPSCEELHSKGLVGCSGLEGEGQVDDFTMLVPEDLVGKALNE